MFRKAALLWIMTAPLTCAFQAVIPITTSNPHSLIRLPSSLFESLEDSQEDSQEQASQKKRKKKGITINPNLVASISSDGIVTNQLPTRSRLQSSTLGVPSRKKPDSRKKSNVTPSMTTTTKPIMSKKDRQRTANGAIDSSRQSHKGDPEREEIQVVEAKRGNKAVTIVRGMTSPMDDRKKLLKEMKSKFGVGGTLVDGVLEIQGSFAVQAVEILKKKGYSKAQKIGK